MSGSKLDELNREFDSFIPSLKDYIENYSHDNLDVNIGVIGFSSGARWVVDYPTKLADFSWTQISSEGDAADTGTAFSLLADEKRIDDSVPMTVGAIVLITDGAPTDDYMSGIEELNTSEWNVGYTRLGILIGKEADEAHVRDFIGNDEMVIPRVTSPRKLKDAMSGLMYLCGGFLATEVMLEMPVKTFDVKDDSTTQRTQSNMAEIDVIEGLGGIIKDTAVVEVRCSVCGASFTGLIGYAGMWLSGHDYFHKYAKGRR